MLKFVAILAFSLAYKQVAAPMAEQSQGDTKAQTQAGSISAPQEVPVLMANQPNESKKTALDTTQAETLPTKWRYREWVSLGVNILLVVIGFGGLIAAFFTLRKLERQTKATEDAAKASLVQAEHIIANERPFLMIEASGYDAIEFHAVNRGKSPAQIIFFNNFPNLNTPLVGEEWSPTRYYGGGYDVEGMEVINVQWIAPDASMLIGTYTLRALREGDPQRWDEVDNLRRQMYLWSSIKYRGLSGSKIYESRYCYLVRPAGPLMAGPPGLNTYI